MDECIENQQLDEILNDEWMQNEKEKEKLSQASKNKATYENCGDVFDDDFLGANNISSEWQVNSLTGQ